jgi:putative DNA primase/helicase
VARLMDADDVPSPPPGFFDDYEESPSSESGSRARSRSRCSKAKAVTGDGTGPVFVRGDHVELGAALLSKLRARGEVVFAEGRLYQFDPPQGLFVPINAAEESRIVQGFAGAAIEASGKPLKVDASDVRGAATLAHDSASDPDFFATAASGLAFANGFVRVSADRITLEPHRAAHRARVGLPFDFIENAPTSFWSKFVGDLFAGDDDADAKANCLQEFAGAALLGIATRFQIALILLGEGANGKSEFIKATMASMPEGSCVAIPPQDWGQEYRRALLANKRLNIVSELPEADILSSEAFKAVISGDAITGRHIREAPFTFTPIAAHLFASNRLPGTTDHSDGFWRRPVVLRFNRVFKGADAVPDIAAKIVAAERPGIVRWMLEGARRLLAAGRYTVPASSATEIAEWRRNADPVALFLAECARDHLVASEGVTAALLYLHFRTWAERNGHRAMSSTKFGMRMRSLGKGSVHTKSGKRYPVALVTGGDGLVTGLRGNPSPN